MLQVQLLALFAALARASALPVVGLNNLAGGRTRGGVASEQATCSDIGRNALVRGVSVVPGPVEQ